MMPLVLGYMYLIWDLFGVRSMCGFDGWGVHVDIEHSKNGGLRMKKCLFCAEDIQDAALRCKHCGADLAAAVAKERAAVKEAKNEKKDAKGFAILGALPFVGIAFWAFKTVGIKYAALVAVFAVVYLFLGPQVYKFANSIRKSSRPSVIIATSASDYIDQQFFWNFVPQLVGMGLLLVVLMVPLVVLLPLNDMVTGVQSPQATTAESAAASTVQTSANPASDAQVAEQQQPAASGPSATEAVTSASDAIPATDNAVQQSAASQPVVAEAVASQAEGAQPQPQVMNVAEHADAKPAAQPVPSAAIVASFDCAKASSQIETLICSSPETADADRRLAAAYSAARSKSSDPSALKVDQRNWLTTERNACTDAACLTKVMEARIQKLAAM